ncbi:MAG: hypothetical protein KPI85_05515 [cyanobacterium endosymbiont of Epithemia adnata isolate EadnSB Bon19]
MSRQTISLGSSTDLFLASVRTTTRTFLDEITFRSPAYMSVRLTKLYG